MYNTHGNHFGAPNQSLTSPADAFENQAQRSWAIYITVRCQNCYNLETKDTSSNFIAMDAGVRHTC
jgi:hypothetical protein